jgi:hypothetical protein
MVTNNAQNAQNNLILGTGLVLLQQVTLIIKVVFLVHGENQFNCNHEGS